MASAQEAEEIIQSLSGHSTLLGKHVEKCAKRLLFELLRYTNDKTFTTANAEDDSPFVTFKVYPDRIVSDCNSDALTKADLEAICRSTNKVNFKTIVAATKRTHIQSGNFSFEFQHNPADHDNADIMRPVWVIPAQAVPDNVTRITLYLHDHGSKDDIQNLRDIVFSQFEDLEPESILFLKNIRCINIESRHSVDMPRSRHFEKKTIDEYRVSVKTTTTERKDSEERTDTELFHLMEKSQPSDDQTGNLMLAFPLTNEYQVEPWLKQKKIFNIVPLAECWAKFHIHTDIDIDDDVDDKMAEIASNLEFHNEVTNLFIKAILQFCEHPTLRYNWPIFLTDMRLMWPDLHFQMRDWISQNPVFLSGNMKHWRLLNHLALPGPDAQDDIGNPLLDDEINDPFLSRKYRSDATEVLEQYGLATLGNAECLALLEMHFNNPSLRSRTTSRSKGWHVALERLLLKLLANDEYSARIKSLPLLQTKDGSMVSAASKPVYFPTTKGIDIPVKLPGRVIKTTANHGAYSKTLYEKLGVVEVSVRRVREVIFNKFSEPRSLSFDDIKTYLGYLYLTHQSFNSKDKRQYRVVRVLTMDMELKNPWESIMYLPGMEHPYTPQSLLGAGMFGLSDPVDFLHPDILRYSPKHDQAFHFSWKKWLCSCLGIKPRLSLTQQKGLLEPEPDSHGSSTMSNTNRLSEHCTYVLKNRPDRFLGLIQHIWDFEGPDIIEDKALLSEIQGLPAQSLCGLDRAVALRSTCVPLLELKDVVGRYMEYPDKFPFLKLQEDKYEGLVISTKWSFLTTFLICPIDEKQRALKYFEDSGILYLDKKGGIWTGISRCLWNAPADIISRYSLKGFYQERVPDKSTMQDLSQLFREVLSIRDASVEDLMEELCLLRDNECNDVARLANIYNYLDKEIKVSPELRTAFSDERVILVQDGDDSMWLSAKECFWSEAERTPMQCSLKTWYPGLKQFFVDKLGVKISAYDKLVYSTPTDVEQVKNIMLSFMDEAAFLHEFEEEPLGTAKIFPVQRPTAKDQPPNPVELCSLDIDFCIGDREYLRKSLQSNIKMLSFDVTKVRRLQPLFRWLSVEDGYLSIRVVEIMNVVPSRILKEWDLRDKAYHIARVAETFNCYGSCNDAFSLYQQLRTTKIAKVDNISMDLMVVQDDQTFQSRSSQKALVYISPDCDDNLTIYVEYNDDNIKQLCFFSVLPRKLQQWLTQDESHVYMDGSFEITNALTSIFAGDAAILDEILEDQGISQVSFQNQDIVETKVNGEAHQQLEKKPEPVILAMRERQR
ncbi:hypothetical protein FSST1_002931 [Fusarium sambucinum]